ncbi:MAG: hypothetical protein V1907_00495 [Candidatus Kerfeldbacteria bacterium]
MELRDSISLFRKRKALAIALIVIVIGGAYAWSYLRPVHYSTSISFAVNRINKEQTAEYQYDGYYALQAADLFSQTVISWLQTPSVVVSIFDRAGIYVSPDSLRSLPSRFKAKKYSAQNIVVTYSTPTEEEGKKLATALSDEIASRSSTVDRNADNKAIFEVVPSKPVIVLAKPNPLLIGIGSLIVAVTLALFLVPLVEYLSVVPRQP